VEIAMMAAYFGEPFPFRFGIFYFCNFLNTKSSKILCR